MTDLERINHLESFIALTSGSMYVNTIPIIKEWARLMGLDPDKVVYDYKEKNDTTD